MCAVTLKQLVDELVSLNDENLARRVVESSDVQWCLSELQDMLEVDAVEVVRCRDCKHFNPDDQAAQDADWSGWCRYNGCLTDDFDFCSRGIDKDFLDGGDDDGKAD